MSNLLFLSHHWNLEIPAQLAFWQGATHMVHDNNSNNNNNNNTNNYMYITSIDKILLILLKDPFTALRVLSIHDT